MKVRFRVHQESLFTTVTVGWGSVTVSLIGLVRAPSTSGAPPGGSDSHSREAQVDVHLDLKHIEVAAINECDGKFAIDGPIAPSVDGVSAALLEEPHADLSTSSLFPSLSFSLHLSPSPSLPPARTHAHAHTRTHAHTHTRAHTQLLPLLPGE